VLIANLFVHSHYCIVSTLKIEARTSFPGTGFVFVLVFVFKSANHFLRFTNDKVSDRNSGKRRVSIAALVFDKVTYSAANCLFFGLFLFLRVSGNYRDESKGV
jgi:hypothetical protein